MHNKQVPTSPRKDNPVLSPRASKEKTGLLSPRSSSLFSSKKIAKPTPANTKPFQVSQEMLYPQSLANVSRQDLLDFAQKLGEKVHVVEQKALVSSADEILASAEDELRIEDLELGKKAELPEHHRWMSSFYSAPSQLSETKRDPNAQFMRKMVRHSFIMGELPFALCAMAILDLVYIYSQPGYSLEIGRSDKELQAMISFIAKTFDISIKKKAESASLDLPQIDEPSNKKALSKGKKVEAKVFALNIGAADLNSEEKFNAICKAFNSIEPISRDIMFSQLEQMRLIIAANALGTFTDPNVNPQSKRAHYTKREIENLVWLLDKLAEQRFPFIEKYALDARTIIAGIEPASQQSSSSIPNPNGP